MTATPSRWSCRTAATLAIAMAFGAGHVAVAQDIDGWSAGTRFRVDPETPEAPGTGSRFGFALAMTDSLAVIGAPDVRLVDRRFPALNLGSNGAGAAFVFRRDAGTGAWSFVQRLIAPVRALAQTGTSMAIDPETEDIVIGAWGYESVAFFSGAAFVYSKGEGDSWGDAANVQSFGALSRVPSQVLAPEDLQAIDQFGFSVAADGGRIAVGCPLSGDTNGGAIYVFDRGGDGQYALAQKVVDENAGANDQMGTKVALHGDFLVAGIQNDDVEGKVNAGNSIVVRCGAERVRVWLSPELVDFRQPLTICFA